jgi:hypothetical protein
MPRSGTSWLSQIVESCPQVRFRLSPFFSYAFKNRVNATSSRDEFESVFRGAYEATDEFMEQTRNRKAGHYPTFGERDPEPAVLVMKMTRFHDYLEQMLRLFPELKVVAIVRNPCGAINSWLRTPREFPAGAVPLDEWRTGRCRKTGPGEFWGFDDWKEVTRLHLRLEDEHPLQFRIFRYEDLVAGGTPAAERIFAFFDLPFGEQSRRFLQESQSRHDDDTHATFKRPEVKDRWRSELEEPIREAIYAELQGTELERFLT